MRRQGLGVGLYVSPEDFHWMHQNGYEVRRRELPNDPNTHESLVKLNQAQIKELFTSYG